MSDRAPVWLVVYACPPHAVDALFDVIDGWALGVGDPGDVVLNEPIGDLEANLSAASSICDALIEAGVSFDVYQDAKYEYDGEGHLYVSGYGRFDYTGGGSGDPMVDVRKLDELLDRVRDEHHVRYIEAALRAIAGYEVRAARDALVERLSREPLTIRRPEQKEEQHGEGR